MAKLTVAGICAELLNNCDRYMTLLELHAACRAQGLDVSEAQVYAGVQSMASTSKCDRGPEKQTWMKLGTGRSAGAGRVPVEPGQEKVRVPRAPKAEHRDYPTDGVIAELTEILGPPSSRPKDRLAHCFVLLGDWCAADILNRTRIVLQMDPKNWFTYAQGPNTVVGFTV